MKTFLLMLAALLLLAGYAEARCGGGRRQARQERRAARHEARQGNGPVRQILKRIAHPLRGGCR